MIKWLLYKVYDRQLCGGIIYSEEYSSMFIDAFWLYLPDIEIVIMKNPGIVNRNEVLTAAEINANWDTCYRLFEQAKKNWAFRQISGTPILAVRYAADNWDYILAQGASGIFDSERKIVKVDSKKVTSNFLYEMSLSGKNYKPSSYLDFTRYAIIFHKGKALW